MAAKKNRMKIKYKNLHVYRQNKQLVVKVIKK